MCMNTLRKLWICRKINKIRTRFACTDQESLPVTTYCCTENKLAEISSSLRQPEQFQKDYNQSKLIIKSADLTENGYPRTLTSSYPSDNVIKTSEVTRQAAEITWGWSRLGNDDGIEGENPSTWRFWKHLKSANHQVIQWAITNWKTWSKGALTSHKTIYGYKYSPIWTEIQSFSRLAPLFSPGGHG